MSRVKLVVQERSSLSEGKVIDIDVRIPEHMRVIGVIRTDFDSDPDGTTRASDDLNPVVAYERINNLVGKLLTQIDLAFTDLTQRQAAKDLFTQIAWNWYTGQTDALVPAWREDKKNTDGTPILQGFKAKPLDK